MSFYQRGRVLGKMDYHKLFKQAPAGLAVIDARSLCIQEVNDAFYEQLCSEGEQISVTTTIDAFYATKLATPSNAQVDSIVRAIRDVVATKKSHCLSRLHVKPQGDLGISAVIEVEFSPVVDDDEVVRNVVHKIVDISSKEKVLQQAEDRDLLDSIVARDGKVGTWQVNLVDGSIDWNASTRLLHGVDEDFNPSLEDALEFYPPEHRERVRNSFLTCIEKKETYYELAELVKATGERIWVRASGHPKLNEQGEVTEVFGLVQDVSELFDAEARVVEYKEELYRTLDNIPDGFLTVDKKWRFIYVNKAAQKLLGKSRAELLKQTLWDLFPETVGTTFEKKFQHAMQTHETTLFEEFYAPLGEYFSVAIHPSKQDLAIIFRSVTKEREQAEGLRILKAAVDRLNDMILITEAIETNQAKTPKIIYANNAFLEHSGYSLEEVIGETPRIMQGPESSLEARTLMRESINSWHPVKTQLINYKKSGEPYWVEIDLVPVKDDSGWVTHWISVQRDITEAKEFSDKLLASEERFSLTAQASQDILWDWNLEENVIWWSDAYAQQFLKSGEESNEVYPIESWLEKIYQDDRSRVEDELEAFLGGASNRWESEYRMRAANGDLLNIYDTGIVKRNEDGKPQRMVGCKRDITEREKWQKHLREQQKLEALGQLTGGVAHDFNNLLTVIKGNAELIMRGLGRGHNLYQLAELCNSAATRGASLTSKLLAFSRNQPVATDVVEINRTIEEMALIIERSIDASIDYQFSPTSERTTSKMDKSQFEAALLNLVINARDAMMGGGKLRVSTSIVNAEKVRQVVGLSSDELSCDDYVCVSVCDSGEGIPEDVQHRIFDPFFTTKEMGKGTGLGLSMIFGFVKKSEGVIHCQSEVGEGTCFELFLPRVAAETKPKTKDGVADTSGLLKNYRVLVVEDDPLVMDFVVTVLESEGAEVIKAKSADEAIQLMKSEAIEFDVLVSDVVMPGLIDGFQLARYVRANRPAKKVILSSGYTQDKFALNELEDADILFLQKPYRPSQIIQLLVSTKD